MRKSANQCGIAALEAVLLLVLAAIIGFTGYKVFKSKQSVDTTTQTAITTAEKQSKSATSTGSQPIKSASELKGDLNALDKENPDDNSADVNQLDSQTASF